MFYTEILYTCIWDGLRLVLEIMERLRGDAPDIGFRPVFRELFSIFWEGAPGPCVLGILMTFTINLGKFLLRFAF